MLIAPLCSGSTANSTFIGDKKSGVLVDIGCSYKAFLSHMEKCDLNVSAVKAVLITHEHSDHIAGLRVFMKNNTDIPVYVSKGTRQELLNKANAVHDENMLFDVSELEKGNAKLDFEIKAFNTPHDTVQSVGFMLTCPNGYKIAYLTDLGHISETVETATLGCNFAVLESNYEPEMLRNNSIYPLQTKQRISSNIGHLANGDSANYTARLIQNGATRIVLAHLSKQNNTPDLARRNTLGRLSSLGIKAGRDFTLDIAEVQTVGKYIAI